MTKPLHPAPYTPAIADLMVEWLADVKRGTIIDPFAGLGLHLPKFVMPGRRVIGYEIEQPWVDAGLAAIRNGDGRTLRASDGLCGNEILRQADSTRLPHRAGSVAAIFTSVCYGNRFADHHKANERCSKCKGAGCAKCEGTGRRNHTRRGYTHDLRAMTGDPDYTLHPNNTGALHYGREYQDRHRAFYREFWRVARPPTDKHRGCRFILNCSNIIRDNEEINSAVWHLATCVEIGWRWRRAERVPTPRMRYGANSEKRVDGEWVFEFEKAA